MNRTLTFFGQGYANPQQGLAYDNSEILVKLDSVVVYQGPVPTGLSDGNRPTGNTAGLVDGNPLSVPIFSWSEAIEFSGIKKLEIHAIKGDFLYTRCESNYMPISYVNTPTDLFSTGRNSIGCFQLPVTGGIYRDPNSNVKINGVDHVKTPLTEWHERGQWYWGLVQGEVFTCDLNISAGLESPLIDSIISSQTFQSDGSQQIFVLDSYAIDKPTSINVYEDNIITVLWGTKIRIPPSDNWPEEVVISDALPPFMATSIDTELREKYKQEIIQGRAKIEVHLIDPAPEGTIIKVEALEQWDPSFSLYYSFETNEELF
jgi:hypothetical protein